MDDKVFRIILALIPIIGAIITGFVIPLIREKIDSEKLTKYEYWAKQAVRAAEMLWVDSGCGADKKQYVINFLDNMFNRDKVVITRQQIEILLESAVKQMKIEESKIN